MYWEDSEKKSISIEKPAFQLNSSAVHTWFIVLHCIVKHVCYITALTFLTSSYSIIIYIDYWLLQKWCIWKAWSQKCKIPCGSCQWSSEDHLNINVAKTVPAFDPLPSSYKWFQICLCSFKCDFFFHMYHFYQPSVLKSSMGMDFHGF